MTNKSTRALAPLGAAFLRRNCRSLLVPPTLPPMRIAVAADEITGVAEAVVAELAAARA